MTMFYREEDIPVFYHNEGGMTRCKKLNDLTAAIREIIETLEQIHDREELRDSDDKARRR